MIRPKRLLMEPVPIRIASTVKKQAVPVNAAELFDALPDWAWIREAESGRVLDINSAAAKGLGYGRAEMIGRSIHGIYFDQKDAKGGRSFAKEVLRKGTAFWVLTLRDKAGRPVEVEIHGSVIKHSGRQALLMVARNTSAQVGERRRALIFYEGFKRSNDVMFYCDRNGTVLDINSAFTKHYGYTREEVIGKKPNILRSRHSTDELYEHMWESILDPEKGYWHGQMINKAKDGREVPLILTITAVKDAAGEILGYISNAVDMSELLALQTRLADSEALATIGEMAAVVAHEIRNPLGSIVMAARQLVEGELEADDREMVLQVLRNESRRLNETLTNFLSYARPRELKLQRSDLNALIGEVCRMVQSNKELVRQIRTDVSLAKNLRPFPMDPDLVRQVFWNIVLNAVQAMDGRGNLSVETGRSGDSAYFKVEDNGPGIPPEKLANVFKAFQTTKQQGTGLGLAIAERIVKAHGGRIEAQSKGRGASFTVYLPCIED
jgi:PAS domain S-box-containing protein